MNDTTTFPIQIDSDEPTDDQLQSAFKKACGEFGDCVADYESDEFTEEFGKQLNNILTEDAIKDLIDKGLMTAMVREDGQIGYILTEQGSEVAEVATALV